MLTPSRSSLASGVREREETVNINEHDSASMTKGRLSVSHLLSEEEQEEDEVVENKKVKKGTKEEK